MLFNIICCIDKNNGISKDNKIPWKHKTDMDYFKNVTTNVPTDNFKNVVIMGYNTFKYCKLLKNRINIILTKTHFIHTNLYINELKKQNKIEDNEAYVFNNLLDVNIFCEKNKDIIYKAFVISNSLYSQFLDLNLVQNMYINQIHKSYHCDNAFYFKKHLYKFLCVSVNHYNNLSMHIYKRKYITKSKSLSQLN